MKSTHPSSTTDDDRHPLASSNARHAASRPIALRSQAWSSPTRRSTIKKNTAPRLQLVADAPPEEHTPRQTPRPAPPTPIAGATDPRWVLAVRTAESLQGDVLPPANRDRLMRLAKALGLTPFDGCLILAMIQDQARRGLIAQHCPAAAAPQLAMIPLPQPREFFAELRKHPARIGFMTAGLLAFQALLVWVWLS